MEAARFACQDQTHPAGTLYVVATPIGNWADITLRALYILNMADCIACEDTRHTASLLRRYGIMKPLLAVHQHNEREGAVQIAEKLQQGERVAYVSDAGTPAISDPGARLVASIRSVGLPILAIPGVSSVTTALSVCGDDQGQGFTFRGFLSTKGKEHVQALASIASSPGTQVFFEAPHRIESTLKAFAELAHDRKISIARELTKQFETVCTFNAGEAAQWIRSQKNNSKGEFVLVVHAQAAAEDSQVFNEQVQKILMPLMEALPLKQAVTLTGELTGLSKNQLYDHALALKNQKEQNDQ